MIGVEMDDSVAIVTLADASLLSRHDGGAARTLSEALYDLGRTDDVRAIVLAAFGDDFCPEPSAPGEPVHAPGDIWSEWYGDYASSSGLYQVLCYSPKVVVAAVQGVCAGAGSALVLCTDLAVASTDAGFHAPFATVPEASFTLAALSMRLNRAKSWAIGEAALDAETAVAWGLVNKAVPRGRLTDSAIAMARKAALMPTDGMAISRLMRETYLDSQSVGREFDQARFYAAALHDLAAGDTSRGSR